MATHNRPDQRQIRDRAHAKTRAKTQAQVKRVEALPVQNPHAAGIDIGSRSHWVCIGLDPEDPQRLTAEFPAHTNGLRQLVDYLRQHGVTSIAMESTGIYWVPLFEMLDSAGFTVSLVNASHTRQIKGRPKTDRLDCQWIYRLHTAGLLAAAMRPDELTVQLRSYMRHRANLVRYAGRHIQHMQKALEQMNLKLTGILSSIVSVTGRTIIKAILRGIRDPKKLAKLKHRSCQHDEEDFIEALTGSYREEHLYALRDAVDAWEFYQKKLDRVDEQIETHLNKMRQKEELEPLPPRARGYGRKPNDPRFDVRAALYAVVGVDLTQIEGISEQTALTIISEIGTDMSKFETVKHFCSWLGLCPNLKKSGGKVQSSRSRPGVNRCAHALRVGANSLWKSHSGLGAYFRKIRARKGTPVAITATAHKLARKVYGMLKNGSEYVKQTEQEYDLKAREREERTLRRRAARMGMQLIAIGHENAQQPTS